MWETQVHNQGAQCKYEDFADELVRDQFIAGLTSEAGTKIHNGAVHWNFILTSSSLFETVFPWLLIQYLWPFFVVEIAPPLPSPLFPLALLTGRQVHSSWERSHLLGYLHSVSFIYSRTSIIRTRRDLSKKSG